MNINELANYLYKLDEEHGFNSNFGKDVDKYRATLIDIVGLNGEVGELSNIFKKIILHLEGKYKGEYDFSLDELENNLKEELADIFIYTLRISKIFNIDIEKEILKKTDENNKRYGNS